MALSTTNPTSLYKFHLIQISIPSDQGERMKSATEADVKTFTRVTFSFLAITFFE